MVLNIIVNGGPTEQSGGDIVRDSDGRPTGLLEENAVRLVQDLILPYSCGDIEPALDRATDHYASEGLSSVTAA